MFTAMPEQRNWIEKSPTIHYYAISSPSSKEKNYNQLTRKINKIPNANIWMHRWSVASELTENGPNLTDGWSYSSVLQADHVDRANNNSSIKDPAMRQRTLTVEETHPLLWYDTIFPLCLLDAQTWSAIRQKLTSPRLWTISQKTSIVNW